MQTIWGSISLTDKWIISSNVSFPKGIRKEDILLQTLLCQQKESYSFFVIQANNMFRLNKADSIEINYFQDSVNQDSMVLARL
jgi:hypothetical protein